MTHPSPTRRSADLVAGGDGRHHRGVGDAQASEAMDAQARIHHGPDVVAHPAGAHRVEDGGDDVAGGDGQRLVAVDLGAGDRKSTRLNSSHQCATRLPSSAWKKKTSKSTHHK